MQDLLQNAIEETVIYSDDQVKLTNRRISCNYITIPISDIECVGTNLRIGLFNSCIGALVISFIPLYWSQLVWPLIVGIVLIMGSTILTYRAYRAYVELYVTAGHHKLRILTAPMDRRDYLYNISEKLASTVIEEKQLQARRMSIEENLPSYINPSMTMLLRMAKDQEFQEMRKSDKAQPNPVTSLVGDSPTSPDPAPNAEPDKNSVKPE